MVGLKSFLRFSTLRSFAHFQRIVRTPLYSMLNVCAGIPHNVIIACLQYQMRIIRYFRCSKEASQIDRIKMTENLCNLPKP